MTDYRKTDSKYEDMISLPHHQSPRHPHMPMEERAAQFSPFAALTGYGDVLEETSRRTEARRELTEEEKARISRQLELALRQRQEKGACRLRLTVFREDPRKEGGTYVTEEIRLKSWDPVAGELVTEEKERIPAEDILEAYTEFSF